MEYNLKKIEEYWQQDWKHSDIYKVSNQSVKPPYYVLDMFPYPSGTGLHVGHPLGYIASDIYSRYKRLKGFNVLHPMGFDSFGLPAEQFALETGQHPAATTEKNIHTFKVQLDKIGFCYDWSRELRTSDPNYYRWTQWIFLKLFKSWYNHKLDKAESIETLQEIFEKNGSATLSRQPAMGSFTADEWENFTFQKKEEILMEYRLAFSSYGEVNWCEELGTVLANDEVVNGVSERGGFPVVKKKMRQWYMRITEYADRLLEGLEKVAFSDSMKEMQKNWIGKSEGSEVRFKILNSDLEVNVYTTRPDTIFGIDFLVLSPEHELVRSIISAEQRQPIDEYMEYVKSRSDRERMTDVKQITGCFTGSYADNPFNNKKIPVWIADYVLAGYGTGAIMAVPCGDQRDFLFAKHFDIPVTNIIGEHFNGEEANPTKEAILQNSGFLNGLLMKDAYDIALDKIIELGIGRRKVNYRMRDAGFSRQRYWGEPFPIIWTSAIASPLNENDLPLELPYIENYGPGPEGEGPLANIREWTEANFTPNNSQKENNHDLTPDPSPKERGIEESNDYGYVNSTSEEWKNTIDLAKKNRRAPTPEEDIIWKELRNRSLDGYKFRRQHPISGYIPDFVCLEKKLIIEIDGGYHNTHEQKIFDTARESWLKEYGYTLLRFSNDDVKKNLPAVLKKIREGLSDSSPLPWRGVGGEVKTVRPPVTKTQDVGEVATLKRETSTMPGYAGSSWYFLRYMDPKNNDTFCDRKISDYWGQVDVYIGGTEHAVGHLLYSRMWTKVLYDLNLIGFDEPFKRLINQGMITGKSYFFNIEKNYNEELKIVSYEKDNPSANLLRFKYGHQFVDGNGKLTRDNFNASNFEVPHVIEWIKDPEGDYLYLKEESEKMSKSKFNVDNPDDVVDKYGADTFRMYEMFLGPVEQSKPWDTKGIEGVHRFLRKLWRLFNDDVKGKIWNEEKATAAELKILHRTIKKIEYDTEHFSFNTAVSAFMVAVNELGDLKSHKREILEPLIILLVPYAPHISEELWHQLGNTESILDAAYPLHNDEYLVETSKEYPVSINGKLRTAINISLDAFQPEVEKIVLANNIVQKWLDGKHPKKIIFVKGKMVNVVI